MYDTVNERIAQIISKFEYKSKRAFSEKIGVAQTSLNDVLRGAEPKFSTLYKILEAEPLVSAEWLLRGEGPMLKSETGKINIDLISEQIESSSLVKVLVKSLESYQKHEDDLLNAIENLKKENNKLKQGLSNLKAS